MKNLSKTIQKRINKGLLLIIAGALSFGAITAVVHAASTQFDDVPEDAWYFEAVQYCAAHDIVNGTSSTTFSPQANLTRGQLVTILGRMRGINTADYTTDTYYGNSYSGFDDVYESAYYAKYVTWARQEGIVSGVSDTEFAPDANVTREQMATILDRYLHTYGYEFRSTASGTAIVFRDASSISSWATDHVSALKNCGVISGSGGYFYPQTSITRAETVAMLYRVISNVVECSSMSIFAGDTALKVNETTQLSVSYAPESCNHHECSYSCSKSGIIWINSAGKVTALKNGSTVVTATAPNGVSASINFTVSDTGAGNGETQKPGDSQTTTVPVESITCTFEGGATNCTLAIGATTKVRTQYQPTNTTQLNLVCTSSNTAVATIDAARTVTAVGVGTANITITAENGASSTVAVTVVTATTNDGKELVITPEYLSAFNVELTRLINEERISCGLTGAEYCSAYQTVADTRSQECCTSFSHTRPDGTYCATAFNGVVDTNSNQIFECIEGDMAPASHFADMTPEQLAKEVLTYWMNSSGHYAVLHRASTTPVKEACGIYKEDAGSFYFAYDGTSTQ